MARNHESFGGSYPMDADEETRDMSEPAKYEEERYEEDLDTDEVENSGRPDYERGESGPDRSSEGYDTEVWRDPSEDDEELDDSLIESPEDESDRRMRDQEREDTF